MCQKRNSIKINILKKSNGYSDIRLDSCLRHIIALLNEKGSHYETLSACCGHKRYQITIVVRDTWGKTWEVFSGIELKRKRRFYKKDSKGFYYIPEVSKEVI